MEKILVIEDEEFILENIKDLLEINNYEVITAHNGLHGYKTAIAERPDLIICDIMMPEMNGFELIETLKNEEGMANIPFIFLSAKSDDSDIRTGMNLGADDYIKKPFKQEDLLSSVDNKLHKKRQVDNFSNQKLENLRQSIAKSLPHEFLTPLNGIIGLSSMLLNDFRNLPADDTEQILQNINLSAERLHHLITNYLYYINLLDLERNPVNIIDNTEIDPKSLINDQSKAIAIKYKRYHDLVLNIENTKIKMHETLMFKLMEELIDNAFKFSESGSKVFITSRMSNNESPQYVIDISNSGRGMTNEQIKNIGAFMQFERNYYEQQGIGLGLSISKKIAEICSIDFKIINNYPKDITIRLIFHI